MNIMHKLTIRHLTENKRRTLVTIIGTIISVAMITAVATLVISFLDLMQRQHIADQGEWHVQFHDINEQQAEVIADDDATNQIILSGDRGYSYLEKSQNKNKPYIFIKEYNESGFENFPMTLIEGRFPENPGEIVLSADILNNAKVHYEAGDQLSLEVGERMLLDDGSMEGPVNQQYSLRRSDNEIKETIVNTETATYEVVGIIDRPAWEPAWAPGYTAVTYTDAGLISESSPVNASVILNKVDRSMFTHAEQLADKIGLGKERLSFNDDLLRYYGVSKNDNLRTTMYSLGGIIIAVIIAGSVALIYNAFAISVSERARHLGMLSSIGATKRQKRNSVFFEGAVIGLVSIPAGILSGLAGIGVTFWIINKLFQEAMNVSEKLTVVITPMSILTAILISVLTIFISTYLPARKASRISAIDAIRQTTDIKLTGKGVRTSKLVRKFFGVEAEIGLKNIKRNKRKYQVTVFSLAVSIVLFLVVSFFTNSLEKSMDISQGEINYDIQITSAGQSRFDEQTVHAITGLEGVTDYSLIQETFSFILMVDESDLSEPLMVQVQDDPNILEQGQYPYSAEVSALDNETLKEYAEEIGIDPSRLLDEETPRAVVVDRAVYEDIQQGKLAEIKTINTSPGEKLDLFYMDWENETKDSVSAVTIEALTDKLPMGITSGGGVGVIKIFVSEAVFSNLLSLEENAVSNEYLYLNSSEPLETQEAIEEMEESVYIYNIYKSREQSEQLLTLMSVFIYGFIGLITVISIANIFNTISTSISLRKREFAMLKSMGMTQKSFYKMINYESVFYGLKSLFYGLPLSIGIMYLLYRSMQNTFEYHFELPWLSILYVIIAVFIIVGSAMLYSISKISKDNIIETLKQENI
ncbi:ABC transporter permease [Evansella clarkii]|uniref:ABC transporter permease n=1 Tax=Evansella clarkii TaxID=79879 RepID=UPI000B43D046|nr:FtsX-like permease family protein [Evansella clarkii]